MTQKIHHNKYFQIGKLNETEMISAAIVDMQTRDGVDEAIVGAGNMVFDPSIGDDGMWVPVTESNPLHTKAQDTEDKLELVRELLEALDGKASTAQGQADIINAIAALAGTVSTAQGQGEITQAIATLAQAVATESTLAEAVQKLTDLIERLDETLSVQGEVTFPSAQEVTLSGQIDVSDNSNRELGRVTIAGQSGGITQTPDPRPKTVSTGPTEIFAGAARLEGRFAMKITNVGTHTIYLGNFDVTSETGDPILPGDTEILPISTDADVPFFAVAETDVPIRVVEYK